MKKIILVALLLSVFVFVSCDRGNCSGDFPNYHKGLCWSNKAPDTMSWNDAWVYCESLGGRLPKIQELRMLIQNCPETEYPKPDEQYPWCKIEDPGNLTSGYSSYNMCRGCSFDDSGKYSVFRDIGRFWSHTSSWYYDTAEMIDFSYGRVFYQDMLFVGNSVRCLENTI